MPPGPVAQPDRASVYETEGHRFESCRARSLSIAPAANTIGPMFREGRVRRCAAFIAIGAALVLTTAESRAAVTVGEVQADPENCAGLFVFNQIESTPAVPYAMPGPASERVGAT